MVRVVAVVVVAVATMRMVMRAVLVMAQGVSAKRLVPAAPAGAAVLLS